MPLDRYPSAPSASKERLEWMRLRNARIQKQDEETYMRAIEERQRYLQQDRRSEERRSRR